MIVNKRKFNEIDSGSLEFDRDYRQNIADICECAALSMHKAIIGISELSSLESAESLTKIDLRISKAVQTYYIVYHLFACCMLLDEKYRITFRPLYGNFEYGTELEKLKRTPRNPDEWNKRKYLESDLAVRITHTDIKNYCGKNSYSGLRGEYKSNGLKNYPEFIQLMYKYFISNNCELCLFEKMDYIRDRSIYRPSHVASKTEIPIQTSKNVRKQIEELPTSDELYSTLFSIMESITNEKSITIAMFFMDFTINNRVDCPTDYLSELGYSWGDLKNVGGNESNESVPSYVAQLIELYNPLQLQNFHLSYWKKLLELCKDYLKNNIPKS